jgi:hypothetical protein
LRSTRDDTRGGFVLSGQKIWTTSAHFADWDWVGARTGAHKHKGISLFLIPMDHPGLTIRPAFTIGDERTNEVFFDEVFVPDAFVVGELNHGWTYICEALDLERFAMMPVGPLEMKVESLCEWVRTAHRDGEPLRTDAKARRHVPQLATQLEVARMLQCRVISEAVKGAAPTCEASQYKPVDPRVHLVVGGDVTVGSVVREDRYRAVAFEGERVAPHLVPWLFHTSRS